MRLEFEVLELHTRHAFHIARQRYQPRRDVWVRLSDGEGNEGWGEAAATPYYGETAETVAAVLPRLGEALEAAAAPLSSFTLGLDEPEAMREKLREAAGFPILKIKVGTPRDEEILGLVRDEAPDKVVRVDANTGWTAKAAIAALPMLGEYRVESIEQPLAPDDLEGAWLLRARSPLPLIADESCGTLADVPRLAEVFDGINIKLAKCGSLREALRMIHCARAHRMSVMHGCMIESTLGIAAAIQLAPLVDHVDLDGAALLADDPFRGPGLEPDGRLRFDQEPGLGVECSSK